MFPFIHIAHAATNTSALSNVLAPIINNVVLPVVELMFSIAVVVFVYGIVEMMMKGDDSAAREQGRWAMLGGIIGMVIMLSAWGLIHLVSNTVFQFS